MYNGSITRTLTDADVLIIVPPFAGIDRPSLGVHTLQACALEQGFKVDVFYANLLFAQRIGPKLFHDLSYGPTSYLLGERLFAPAAYGHDKPAFDERFQKHLLDDGKSLEEIQTLITIAAETAAWVESVARELIQMNYKVVGATSTFEQTAACIAFLNAIKRLNPQTTTLIGGANCEGPMADGIATLSPLVDYIFSGESESTFLDFLTRFHSDEPPTEKIFYGEPNRTMESLPCPDYEQFYQQFDDFIDPAKMQGIKLWLPYESSRGCWWGQKHHCTFCGLNGSGMVFRQKSAARIITDLRKLGARHPNKLVTMADNIMPNNYFKTLLPHLGTELPGYDIFYEVKANLDLPKVMLLKQAGITSIQPGIEALSTPLLRLMDKGVSAAQNIALLRYGETMGVEIRWNLLCGFPGDKVEWYEDTLRIITLIPHLPPPSGMYRLSIDRFSPYFERAADYGINELRPSKSYMDVLPDDADVYAAAYHFVGNFQSDTYQYPDLMKQMDAYIASWNHLWQSSNDDAIPVLSVTKVKDNLFVLKDTRGLPNSKNFQFINREQASVALIGLPISRRDSPYWQWGVDTGVAVELDNHLVPLALTEPEVFFELESTVNTSAPVGSLIMPS